MPCVPETDSGVKVRICWLERLLAMHNYLGRVRGPVFINEDGHQSSTAEMNDQFIEKMLEIFEESRELFEVDKK